MNKKLTPLEIPAESADETVEAAVRIQQQMYLVRQISLVMPINMAIAVLVAAFMTTFTSLWPVLAWLAVMLSVSAIQFAGVWRLRRRPPPKHVSGRNLRRAEFWSGAIGLLWASTIFIFYAEQPVRYHLFLALVLVGLASGGVAMLQAVPRVSGLFAGAIIAPLIVTFLFDGDPLHVTVAILSAIFFYSLLNSSHLAYRRLLTMVESTVRFEGARSDLVDAIESIRDAFAVYGPDGRIKLANERFKSWFGDCRNLSDVPGTAGLYRMPGGVWLQGYVRPMSDGSKVSVHTDVTALKGRERELIAAKLQAEEASSAKSHFLAHMSHELRTPLNAIMGFAEIMRKGMFGPLGAEKYRQYVDDIHDSAAHLLSVINDILNLSRIQSSNYEIRLEEVDISRIIDSVLDALSRQKRGLETSRIDVNIDPAFGLIRADNGALQQALLNLVRNAVKFTPPDGEISIEAKIDALGRPCISVLDTGIGIPQNKLNAVRQPFQQLEGAFQRKFKGTGLGLSIADALVRTHGGSLEIESRLGKGTQATVILPAELRIVNHAKLQAS